MTSKLAFFLSLIYSASAQFLEKAPNGVGKDIDGGLYRAGTPPSTLGSLSYNPIIDTLDPATRVMAMYVAAYLGPKWDPTTDSVFLKAAKSKIALMKELDDVLANKKIIKDFAAEFQKHLVNGNYKLDAAALKAAEKRAASIHEADVDKILKSLEKEHSTSSRASPEIQKRIDEYRRKVAESLAPQVKPESVAKRSHGIKDLVHQSKTKLSSVEEDSSDDEASDDNLPGRTQQILPGVVQDLDLLDNLPGQTRETDNLPGVVLDQDLIDRSKKNLPGVVLDQDLIDRSKKNLPGVVQDLDLLDNLPGQTRDILPGRTRDILPGQTRDILPGQTRDILPGQTRHILPGQTRDILPGRTWGMDKAAAAAPAA